MSKAFVVSALLLTLLAACGSQPTAPSTPIASSAPSAPASSPPPPAVGREGRATEGAAFYAKKDDLEDTLSATASGSSSTLRLVADMSAGKASILDEGTRLAVREISGLYLRAEPLDGARKGSEGWMLTMTVTGTDTAAPAAAQSSAPSAPPSPAAPSPPSTYSKLTIDNAVMENGTVIVTGSTDLPDGAKINVDFNVVRTNPKESYIGVSDNVLARAGQFRAELTPPDHPDLAAGPNEVEVLFTPMAQEPDILRIVGEDGERLSGPSADKSLGFTLLKTSKRVPILLTKKTYAMVNPSSYSSGTAERAVADYLAAWKAGDWARMVASTQLTWRDTTNDPAKRLQSQYEIRRLLGAEITGREHADFPAMVDVSLRITYSVGSEVETQETTYRVIRETGPYEPSADRGTWGVNPISAL